LYHNCCLVEDADFSIAQKINKFILEKKAEGKRKKEEGKRKNE
jgi:hypothetical protein